MITVRPSEERAHFDHGWLDTRHTFSFASYHDPDHMGFRALRVINEDVVQPGHGFGTHPHRDMEIVTLVLEGTLEHRDSTGGGGFLRPDELQHMTAGTGITHSEMNPSATEPVHLLQIWLLPEAQSLPPSYEQRTFPEAERRGRFQAMASADGRDGSLILHQDAALLDSVLAPGESATYTVAPGRHAWVQVARGAVELNGTPLRAGDGAAVSAEERLQVTATAGDGRGAAEVLLFDLA